jgi:hypothetical protein
MDKGIGPEFATVLTRKGSSDPSTTDAKSHRTQDLPLPLGEIRWPLELPIGKRPDVPNSNHRPVESLAREAASDLTASLSTRKGLPKSIDQQIIGASRERVLVVEEVLAIGCC